MGQNQRVIPGPPDDLPEPPDRNPPSSGVRRGDHSTLTVHTGDGKGKTTAAFGSALRAWHQGWPIAVYQFVKSGR